MSDVPELLYGPYTLPRLRIGDRATCQVRDCTVVVTSWTDAPITWPRCRALESHGGGSGLLVDDELARAIRNESALALKYWWGVTAGVVWRWRKALRVGRMDPEGSRRLILAACQSGADAVKEREFTEAEREVKRQQALALDLSQHLQPGYHGPRWTDEQLALLGKMPDAELAAIVGKSANAVRVQRSKRGIPSVKDGSTPVEPSPAEPDVPLNLPAKPRKPRPRSVMEPAWRANRGRKHTEEARRKMSETHRQRGTRPTTIGRPWTAEEDDLVRTLPPSEVVARTGRTLTAVYVRRSILGLNDGRTTRWPSSPAPT